MCNHLTTFLVAVVVMLGVAGCGRIEEPWVSSDKDLKQQRERTATKAEQLRDRLISTQADR